MFFNGFASNFVCGFTRRSLIIYIPVFAKVQKFSDLSKSLHFLVKKSPDFRKIRNPKIWDSRFVEHLILYHLVFKFCFYLNSLIFGDFFLSPCFSSKIQWHDLVLTSLTCDLLWPETSTFAWTCQKVTPRGTESCKWISLRVFELFDKSDRGGIYAPHRGAG